MVGIVVVSHSRTLARSAVELASQMLHGARPRIAVAAGLDDTTLGTDAVQVKEAIEQVDGSDGVVVLLDLGSAVLSAELALDLLDDAVRERVIVSPAPLVEGLVAATVTAAGGGTAHDVAAEAAAALAGKQAHLSPAALATPARIDGDAVRGVFVVANTHGLHARPAARLVAQVRTLDARVQLTNRTTGAGPVPASSLSRVATLGALQGHEIEVAVTGSQATEALEHILALAARHFNGTDDVVPPPKPVTAVPLVAAPGIAIGPARRADAQTPSVPDDEPGDPVTHWRRLREAIAATRRDLGRTRARVSRESGESDAAIFDAHLMLLDDGDLLGDVRSRIDRGVGAARAWHDAVTRIEREFVTLDDPYLRARAADVRAVGEQVLRHLLGLITSVAARPGILVAPDLASAQAAELDPAVTTAAVLAFGSPTSHAAILARAKGVPLLVAAGADVLGIADGTPLVVDADTATLIIDPADDVRADYEHRLAERTRALAAAHAAAAAPAVTVDGATIAVCANVGSVDDAKAAADAHADGAGLVRTEFLFQARTEPPTAEEQETVYRAITDAFGGRRVVFRTLDAGADKPLPFLPAEPETNPYLGVRGIRLALRRPRLLRDQLQAICAVAADAPVSVMFPMVSTVDELRAALAVLDEACAGERPEGLRIGMMLEVPSAALKAAAFAPHLDFFSVGTNDLTQYALAAERGNPALGMLADPLDPGVLHLVDVLCRNAGTASVSICGEATADPLAVPLFVGLGADSLSVAAPCVASIKQAVCLVDKAEAAKVATKALHCATAAEVRRLFSAALIN